ncbi:hypothetical protein [Beijerinckia mobilis]|nr:hypothetical protein [Beijerinckia mobilis]
MGTITTAIGKGVRWLALVILKPVRRRARQGAREIARLREKANDLLSI